MYETVAGELCRQKSSPDVGVDAAASWSERTSTAASQASMKQQRTGYVLLGRGLDGGPRSSKDQVEALTA